MCGGVRVGGWFGGEDTWIDKWKGLSVCVWGGYLVGWG